MYTINEIDDIVKRSLSSVNLSGEPCELYDPIEYIISIGGKRLRPKLCLLSYNLFSNNINDSIIYPTLALEIFHEFTLIHDDIMDKSDMRRGQLTVHKKWNDNIAILSGDVMSIKSYEFLSYAPAEYLQNALKLFSRTAAQICEGQQFDMNFESKPFITIEDYLQMIGLKTAVLLACSTKLGAVLAGADDKTADALYNFGYQMGIAFQIKDDYLDVYGDSAIFGKKIGGDILNNKKSWLLVEAIHLAQGENQKRLQDILNMGIESGEEKISQMKDLYEELNIKELAEREIEKYSKDSMSILENINIEESKKETLKEFALSITNREK